MDAGNGQGKKQIRVGFYDIEGTIGKGNFAVVKLARHRITKTEASLRKKFTIFNFYKFIFIPNKKSQIVKRILAFFQLFYIFIFYVVIFYIKKKYQFNSGCDKNH